MDLLPHAVQLTAAWLIFFGLVIAAVIGVLWLVKWVRNYFDTKTSAIDT